MTGNPKLKVGFIGAGQLGLPMVEKIVASGADLTVFARRPETAASVAELGVDLAASIEELAASVDVLSMCTFNDDQLRQVVFGSDGGVGALASLRSGAVLVSHTTGSPVLIQEMAAAAPAGVGVIDGPVSGTAESIRSGELTILIGASKNDLEIARPVLSTYGSRILHVGPVGAAQRAKLINNLVFAANLRVAAAAIDLGCSLEIEPQQLASVLSSSSGRSLPSTMLERVPISALLDSARPFLRKDLEAIRAVALELDADLGVLGDLANGVVDTSPQSDGLD